MTGPVPARFGTEHVVLSPGANSATWWTSYADRLQTSGISATSRDVIGADARFIVDRGIFGAGEPGTDSWPASRERRGLVMGAVQSGKTASMMAVAAHALDRGVDALVVLGGTRTSLWVQTLERVLDQLDTLPEPRKHRVRVPSGPSSELAGSDLDVVYSLPRSRAEQALRKGRPFLVVAMKNTAHLERLGRRLHDVVYPAAVNRARPFHVLVIDDEADDSSVMDGSSDTGDALDVQLKQVPRRIIDLWEDRSRPGETASPNVFATYLAYTATPQANFLQDASNPLAPTDFVASLRTPGAAGDPEVRESSYRVPEGARGWYMGGEIFYKALSDVPLCIPTDDADQDDLVADGARGYLVASAVRLLRAPGRAGPATARSMTFTSHDEVLANVMPPMSMLVNPAATMDSHFELADRILDWSYGTGGADHALEDLSSSFGRALGTAGIQHDMHEHRDRWLAWLDRYRSGVPKVETALGLHSAPEVSDDWALVCATIMDEVIPGTGVAVINSDERADDRPQFSPREEGGTWFAPTNSSTIFVSGNVMSRGLTLEGLSTTLFTRSAYTPLADTQMQMQRWFGYRGGYIDLCRVLMPRDQIELFTHYHENDEALRRDVLKAMESGTTPDLTILQGRAFRATGKIANLHARPLFPGPKPFIAHMNPPGRDDDNLRLVADLFSGAMAPVLDSPAKNGLMLAEPVDLLEAADVLDRIRYVDHGSGIEGYEAIRWQSAANHAQVPDGDPVLPFFRAPLVTGSTDLGSRSPYEIAAYLRLWEAAIPRQVPGLMTTDDRPVPWNLVDKETLSGRRPQFWMGLRFGSGDLVDSGPLAEMTVPVRPMRRALVPGTNDLHTTWGSRNSRGAQIMGDEVFERSFLPQARAPRLDLEGKRLPGSDGLILFHVIAREDGSQSLAIGLGIPLGGPDHIRARAGANI